MRKDIDTALDFAIGPVRGRDRRLWEAMRYAAIGGGKRFRALLVAAVSELVGGTHGQALRVGAAIECVHAQSLIHDDLPCMDNDDLRRGRPTMHRQFDEATAVLAGDALLALAFEILADEATHPDAQVRAQLVLVLARVVGQDGLAGGQMMDLYPPARPSAQDLFECESRKTGALIRFAVEAGAMLGQCSADERLRLLAELVASGGGVGESKPDAALGANPVRAHLPAGLLEDLLRFLGVVLLLGQVGVECPGRGGQVAR